MHVESYVKISRCVENVYVRRVENHIENRVEVRKKHHHTLRHVLKLSGRFRFLSFGFACVSEVRHMISVYWVMFHLLQEILTKKNNWLRLRWLRQRQAEAETETSHFAVAIIDHDCCHKNMCIRFEFGKREPKVGFKVILHHIVRQ